MKMVAWMLRVVGCLVLAAGTVLAVGDVARSLASDRVRLMTIGEAVRVAGLGPASAEDGQADPARAGVFATDGRGADPMAVLAIQPASVVLGAAGIALLFIGRSGRRPGDRERLHEGPR